MGRTELLSSTHAKFNRATNLARVLVDDIASWTDLDPIHLVPSQTLDQRTHLFHWSIEPLIDEWRWSCELGDTVHNFRCALDHVVYAVATYLHGSAPPPDARRVQFPICSAPKFWDEGLWRLKTLPDEVIDTIESFQPYHHAPPLGRLTALAWLSHLDDIDKHRQVHFTPCVIRKEMIDTFLIATTPPKAAKVEMVEGPIFHQSPCLRITLEDGARLDKLDFDLGVSHIAVFGDEGGIESDLRELLLGIQAEVQRIVETMEQFIV